MVSVRSGRLHVLEVIGNADVGGMENAVARLIERLPGERFAVSALCPFESPYTDRLRGLGADVHIVPMPEDPPWMSIQRACALVRLEAIDIIHSHLQNAHVLAALTGRLTGRPVLATIHGRRMTLLDLEVHRAAGTHVSVVSHQSYYSALGLGASPTQLHFIPNGVDTELYRPDHRSDGPLRRRFGIAASAKVIGFVGRFTPEKAPDVFLRMAFSVHEAEGETRFLLLGEGPMRPQLERFIDRFDLGGAVHLAGMQADMPAALAELDVVVSTSHSEAMPLAIMEAMASGLPVVATAVGGVPDLVQHDVTGWLADDADYEGLASRVIPLLRDDALRREAGLAARRRAVERLSLPQSVRQLGELLVRLGQPPAESRRISTVARDGRLVDPGRPAATEAGELASRRT